MQDLDTLKRRLSDAEQGLQAAETARNREFNTLLEMWREIDRRYETQQQQIAEDRAKMQALIEQNEELAGHIDALLGSIEGTMKRAEDSAIAEIAQNVRGHLDTEPSPPSLSAEDVQALLSPEPEDDPVMDPAATAPPVTPSFETPSDPPPVETPPTTAAADDADDVADISSPGIRGLIGRLEGSFGSVLERETAAAEEAPPAPQTDLDRELNEIEELRAQLAGLKERMDRD